MKDGRTHLAHKAEHATDLDSGAVMAVVVADATVGDCTTLKATMVATATNLTAVVADESCAKHVDHRALRTWVADKGYHSNNTMTMAADLDLKTYISEPKRGRRRWEDHASARAGTYANRRRLRSKRGRAWMRKRGELIERSFAHCLETGGMRRVHLRGRDNIFKRYCVHVAGFNLGLVMRKLIGFGTPRGLQGRLAAIWALLRLWITWLTKLAGSTANVERPIRNVDFQVFGSRAARGSMAFSTGC
jgi:transposase